ncbi:TPA: hypothetical protein QDB06_000806 [Burkholderia vietnamiensis]|nr:hypothetical protein [Burkholderia vietnamiensis]
MNLEDYETLLHDATVHYCFHNELWFEGCKNNTSAFHTIEKAKHWGGDYEPAPIPAARIFDSALSRLAKQASFKVNSEDGKRQIYEVDFKVLTTLTLQEDFPELQEIESRVALVESKEDYLDAIYQSTVRFCVDNNINLLSEKDGSEFSLCRDYDEELHFEDNPDSASDYYMETYWFHGFPWAEFTEILADDVFVGMRDDDYNYDTEKQTTAVITYLNKTYQLLAPKRERALKSVAIKKLHEEMQSSLPGKDIKNKNRIKI